jgi:hypothetical protein
MSVTLSLFAGAGAQFLDNSGNVLTGGLIYTYNAGTTTPLATYTSNLGNTYHPNPIILDASGRVPGGEIWLSNGFGYKFVTKDSNNVLIGTYDNIPSSAQPPITNDASSIYYEEGSSTTAGAFIVGDTYLITSVGTTNFQTIGASANQIGVHFIATGVGTGTGTAQLSRTVQNRLQDAISVKDFGAVGDGTTNDTATIQLALNSSAAVFFPEGTYKITSALTLNAGNSIYGFNAATINQTGTNVNAISANAIDNLFINGLKFQGTNTGTGITNSNGLFFNNCSNVTVSNCVFDGFGSSSDGAAINFYVDCTDLLIENNYITGGIGGGTGSDILVYSNSGKCIITNNQCLSTNSQGIFTNATAGLGECIITGNICKNHSRHGIIGAYNSSGDLNTVISNNICMDNGWSGIYWPVTSGIGNSVVISNNVVNGCGGETGASTTTGGILVTNSDNTNNVLVTGNFIRNSGRTSAGVSRALPASGIRVGGTGEILITSNFIDYANDSGVFIGPNDLRLTITGNDFVDCVNGIRGDMAAGTNIYNLNISNNQFRCTNVNGNGIYLTGLGNSVRNLSIQGNTLWGAGGAGKFGLFIANDNILSGIISGNIITAFDTGFEMFSYAATAQLGNTCTFTRNTISACNYGISVYQTATLFGFIEENTLTGNTQNYTSSVPYLCISTQPNKVFYATAAPTTGPWFAGSRAINSVPTVGQPKAWVCTVTGTPGTWVSEGNL